MKKVSLADVASAAGVGKATASRALSPSPHADVREATRQHVRRIAEQLGYRPSRTAQALRTGRHLTLSLVVPLESWGWWAPVLQGATAEANRLGYQLLIHPLHESLGLAGTLEELSYLALDGLVIVTPEHFEASQTAAVSRGLPTVLIDDVLTEPPFVTVRSDNAGGGALVARHLLARGRRRPLIVAPSGQAAFIDERIAGFRSVLAEAGIACEDEAILISDDDFDQPEPDIERLARRLTSCAPFDCVFALTDYLAAPVLGALRKAGYRVPQDVAVAGFDDERIARLVDPPLTTVHQPTAQLGELAVRLVVEGQTEAPEATRLHTLPVSLVERASS
ncbi:LacI family DNA-binding transcriptional regulator [Salinicola avicenniae]|uniref:LacI family DNA-binding transcriptional regulator n=1 Tax=Salinicola avicenniae TaxID=2916836 RepID=UPI002072FBB3|nr:MULTISPECIES: LacI family DNA-binding transcriptional regulator [unclassified Salinicola]